LAAPAAEVGWFSKISRRPTGDGPGSFRSGLTSA
jgi:hypothetical protein